MNLPFSNKVRLSEKTTLRVGGEAEYFFELNKEVDLEKISEFLEEKKVPFLCLGGGSNLLFSDAGFSGLVIKNNLLGRTYEAVDENSERLIVGAGEVFDEVIAEAVEKGLWGLENLSAIPGSSGATPVQNVGAYGVEVAKVIDYVEVFHIKEKVRKRFSNEDCQFGYRDSFFKTEKGREYIILRVAFLLKKKGEAKIDYADLKNIFLENKNPTLKEVREAVMKIRAGKFPDLKVVGTAGSFFKNPVVFGAESEAFRTKNPDLPTYPTPDGKIKLSLGFILDKICHLKGYRKGNVALFEKQALVLVNYGQENADEIKAFVEEIKEIVFLKTGIKIEPEVNFVE